MIFDILLSRSQAFCLSLDKNITKLFRGLEGIETDAKKYVDEVWLDIFPQTTRQLEEWELQFGIVESDIPLQERRDRLEARWKARGGQSPRYIQDTLQAAGFPVYIHEAWDLPLTNPATFKNPNLYLRDGSDLVAFTCEAGELDAHCGEALAECGETLNPRGYLLVNKVANPYVIPGSSTTWPYFLYIGAETFPNIAAVDATRRDEFEALCLQICPTQQWLGILVEYA
jgi:hypothetical protein